MGITLDPTTTGSHSPLVLGIESDTAEPGAPAAATGSDSNDSGLCDCGGGGEGEGSSWPPGEERRGGGGGDRGVDNSKSNSLVEQVASGKPGGSELPLASGGADSLWPPGEEGRGGGVDSTGSDPVVVEVEEAAGILPPLAWAVKYLSNFAILALLSSCSFFSFLFWAPLLCLGLLNMMLFSSFHTQQHNNAL